MSLGGIDGRNSKKSIAAFAFVCPCRAYILLHASARISFVAHGGICNGLTCSVHGRESKRRVKRILPFLVHKTCVLRAISGYCGSSRAILATNASVMRLSSISGGHRHDSLYKIVAYIVL